MLTRSLHTVTATVNVARHLLASMPTGAYPTAVALADRALTILGYAASLSAADPTALQILKQCEKAIATAQANGAKLRAVA